MKYLILVNLFFLFDLADVQALEFKKDIDKLFTSIDQKNSPGCSVGLIEDGSFILNTSYGLANLEHNIPLSSNSIHRIASLSKQFTAMAVLLLAEEGKINLDEDIRKYLPDLNDYGAKVTINSMLGHFSGMADYDYISGGEGGDVKDGANIRSIAGGPARLGNEDYLTITEFYNVVKNVPLRHPPNEKWHYSNLAYFLLSILVEEVSGSSLREYADKRIFKPLAMTSTFFSDNPVEVIKNKASGYKKLKNGRYVVDMTNLFWVGDGGLHTNIIDMLKWDQNFYSPKIGKDAIKLMKLFNKPNGNYDADGKMYANGQEILNKNQRKYFRHSGSWLGTATHYERYPNERFSSIVFCNDTSHKPWEYADQIARIYFENQREDKHENHAK